MNGVPLVAYLSLGLFMFTTGVVGVIIRRNPIVIFMCIELMLNAVNLTFLAFARYMPLKAAGRDAAQREHGRTDDGDLCDGGRRRRSRGRAGHHHGDLPPPQQCRHRRDEPASGIDMTYRTYKTHKTYRIREAE